jgi:hypothetical protein
LVTLAPQEAKANTKAQGRLGPLTKVAARRFPPPWSVEELETVLAVRPGVTKKEAPTKCQGLSSLPLTENNALRRAPTSNEVAKLSLLAGSFRRTAGAWSQ